MFAIIANIDNNRRPDLVFYDTMITVTCTPEYKQSYGLGESYNLSREYIER